MSHRGQGHLGKGKVLGISGHNHCFYFSIAQTDTAIYPALALLCRVTRHAYPAASISNRYFQNHQQSQRTPVTKRLPRTLQHSPVVQLPGERSEEGETYHRKVVYIWRGYNQVYMFLGMLLGTHSSDQM